MRVGPASDVHLTYCTNVHPGESWPEVFDNMRRYLPAVKARVCPGSPFGVGLRLSADAARELARSEMLAELQDFLRRSGLYVFTINGFPYGTFHGVSIKERVYLPDWRDELRLAYTNQLADILASLLPSDHGVAGSISTVPCAFASADIGPADLERMAELLVRHVAHVAGIRGRTGHTIALALEPEPACVLETITDAVGFFEKHLFAESAVARLRDLTGLDGKGARDALRRHLGVCLDLCHAAVEFEDPAQTVARLRAAQITVAKVQISAGLRVENISPATCSVLRGFDDGVYLHQVVERRADVLRRYVDLTPAFAATREDAQGEWRVHFHVPIFLADLGALSTTQSFLLDILALHRLAPISRHLEVETYTWGVLPEEHRSDDIVSSISRELEWVLWRLAA